MTEATPPTRSIAAILVAAILALVLLLLGVAYLAIGLAGGPQPFTALGAVFVAASLVLAGVWLRLRTRARVLGERETAARRAHTRATVVAVEPHPYIRVGSLMTVTLTVRTPAGELSRRLHLSPLAPGPGRADRHRLRPRGPQQLPATRDLTMPAHADSPEQAPYRDNLAIRAIARACTNDRGGQASAATAPATSRPQRDRRFARFRTVVAMPATSRRCADVAP